MTISEQHDQTLRTESPLATELADLHGFGMEPPHGTMFVPFQPDLETYVIEPPTWNMQRCHEKDEHKAEKTRGGYSRKCCRQPHVGS
jgi:hypothetical protein